MEHERDPPIAILIEGRGRWRRARREAREEAVAQQADTISNFLFELIRNGSTCGAQMENGCGRTVSHIQAHQNEAFFTSHQTGRTPLHELCLRNGCRHIVQALLAANSHAALEQDHSGNTPLHLLFVDFSYFAVSPDEVEETVADLLAVNPETVASAINSDGSTALHIAAASPESMIRPSVLQRLIDASETCTATRNNNYQTPLAVYCSRRHASVEIARILVNARPRSLLVTEFNGWNPLHHAANNGNTNLIQYLVESEPDAARARSHPHGRTALHLVARHVPREVHLPAIEALLRAAPDAVTMADGVDSRNPLHFVCRGGGRQRLSIVRAIATTNPGAASMADNEGYLPLHYACETGADAEVIVYLLSVYQEAASVITRKRDSALHIACTANASTETVAALIAANKSALTLTNDYGFSPLHCVCRAYLPKVGIVRAVLQACPESVTLQTHGGETPLHLACSSGAFVSVLDELTRTQNAIANGATLNAAPGTVKRKAKPRMTNKIGNTPLHEACFRGSSFEQIETLARANPEWISVRNNAGYTPLQVMCKGGRLDEHVVNTFARLRGPEIFSVVESNAHTPLHSACREGTPLSAIVALINAYPDALHMKTSYGDLPLHLACFRGANVGIVCKIAEESCDGKLSPALKPNYAGQTPLGVAMDEFQSVCRRSTGCCVADPLTFEHQRSFDVLKALVKFTYYGTAREVTTDEKPTSLLRACVCLHRQDIRLDPAFIRRAIHVHPEELRMLDEDGNYPLHIEASIPVEKMSLLDSQFEGCCEGRCHSRMGVLGMLLDGYPEATKARNHAGEFPISLMIRNGRVWDRAFALAVRTCPEALLWYQGINGKLIPNIFALVARDCGVETLFELMKSKPEAAQQR